MDITAESAQYLINVAQAYIAYSEEVEDLKAKLSDAEVARKRAEIELKKCTTIEVACDRNITTTSGDIGVYGKKEVKAIRRHTDQLVQNIFDNKLEFTCDDGGNIVVDGDEVYHKNGNIKLNLESCKPMYIPGLAVDDFRHLFNNRDLRVIKLNGKVYYGDSTKSIGYSIIYDYLNQLVNYKGKIDTKALTNIINAYKANGDKLSREEVAATDILKGDNGPAVRIIAKLAELLGLLDTMTVYYL